MQNIKLYQYDELKKLNQALGSFKRNGVPIKNVQLFSVENKVVFFVLTDPEINFEDKPAKKEKVEAKAKVKKADVKKKDKKEAKKEEKIKTK